MRSLALASLASLALAKPKPFVSPETFPDLIHLDDLLAGAQKLQDFAYAYPDRNRVFGGAAHTDTVNWLVHELKRTGYYHVTKQPQVHLWSRAEESLSVAGGDEIDAKTMTYSPSVEVSAELAVLGSLGCSAAEYEGKDVAGKVVLVQRGECTFGEKSVYAAANHAAATIVYNNGPGGLAGTLGAAQSDLGPYSAIVGITQADGEALIALTGQQTPVTVNLWVNSQLENRTTYNVIAQTKTGDANNVVTLGGHTDSVDAGPGINDDGSGIISNLVIAKALSKFKVKNAVRFGFWTAEEFGLLGSEYYVNSLSPAELDKIKLYLNFDMIASPNYALMLYDGDGSAFNVTGPPGSAEIESLFADYFAGKGLPTTETAFDGRSDYEAFILNGIPAGGVFTGAEGVKTEEEAALFGGTAGVSFDENYHAVGDTVDNLNHEAFLINARATAFAVATYANSLESIPGRKATVVKRLPSQVRREQAGKNKIGSTSARQRVHRHAHSKGCFHDREVI